MFRGLIRVRRGEGGNIRISVPADTGIDERSIGEGGKELFKGSSEGRFALERDRRALFRETDLHFLAGGC